MSKISQLLRRKTLWVVFLGAFLPLLFVLILQYWWLLKLERTSVVAGMAVFNNFLEAVRDEVLYTYGSAAERSLDLPAYNLADGHTERVAARFKRVSAPEARRLFVIRFSPNDADMLLFYDPATSSMIAPPTSDETRAVTVASAPWKMMSANGVEVDKTHILVEERDPENRIILNPIIGEGSRVIGVVGMILDTVYFKETVLPSAIKTALPKFVAGDPAESVTVRVWNDRGSILYATDPLDKGSVSDSKPFSFVFTDWRVGIRSRSMTPEQWAHASFSFNVGLSVLAAVLLLGGLLLVLRTASREMRLSRMKSDFVSNVSHELRTPLASIRVFGEFLSQGRATAPEKVREYGEYIETESRRLTQLINNILDFAKIESGQKTYHFAAGDVGAVLAATLKTFEVRLKHSGFDLTFERSAGPLPSAVIDPDALGQALHNLLDNAVNYSGDSRRIGVSLTKDNGEIVVSVSDHGIGISPDEQEKIFDRFHRVSTGLVHEVRGSGLGLAIVQHIVHAHAGRVTVESTPGRGSCFSIHLPAGTEHPTRPGRSVEREH